VEITKPFYLGVYEVTQRQYRAIMGKNPSHFCAGGPFASNVKDLDTDDFPVETVSWAEAVEFCKKLSALTGERAAGRVYRLPREAEWEYACRGGASSSAAVAFGNSLSSTQANFDGNIPYGGAEKGRRLKRTCRVGSYKPNAFGLYDMHGNVCEWCADWYDEGYYKTGPPRDPAGPVTGSVRVFRGGSWDDYGWFCRSASRRHSPGERFNHVGFRVALEVPDGGR